MESLNEVSIHQDLLDHKVKISVLLRPDICLSLIDFLKQQHDYFAWFHTDMTSFDPEVMVHHLQVDPSYPLVRQKRRKFTSEHSCIINEEI